jgi:hypothetical protein
MSINTYYLLGGNERNKYLYCILFKKQKNQVEYSDTSEISSYRSGDACEILHQLIQIKAVHITISDVMFSGTKPFSFCLQSTYQVLNMG